MIKRTSCLVFITIIMFCVMKPVFARFNIEVINESGQPYEKIELVITAVGFDAMYGRISLGEIEADPSPRYFSPNYEYCKLPLTGTSMPSSLEGCNLNIMIIACPKQPTGILTRKYEKIVKSTQIIEEEEPRTFPGRPPMHGICPPYIKIRITGESPNGIEAEFE